MGLSTVLLFSVCFLLIGLICGYVLGISEYITKERKRTEEEWKRMQEEDQK